MHAIPTGTDGIPSGGLPRGAFFCHSSNDSEFVIQVAHHFKRNFPGEVFYYEAHQRADQDFVETISAKAKLCRVMIVFVGPTFDQSGFQKEEVNIALRAALGGGEGAGKKI